MVGCSVFVCRCLCFVLYKVIKSLFVLCFILFAVVRGRLFLVVLLLFILACFVGVVFFVQLVSLLVLLLCCLLAPYHALFLFSLRCFVVLCFVFARLVCCALFVFFDCSVALRLCPLVC